MVIVNTDANGCVNMANALTQVGVTDPKKIVGTPLCLNAQVPPGSLGDFPKWTYGIASSLDGDTSDRASRRTWANASTAMAPTRPTRGTSSTSGRFYHDQVPQRGRHTAASTRRRVLPAAKAFKGPQALGAPSLDCGKSSPHPRSATTGAVLQLPGEERVHEDRWLAPASVIVGRSDTGGPRHRARARTLAWSRSSCSSCSGSARAR